MHSSAWIVLLVHFMLPLLRLGEASVPTLSHHIGPVWLKFIALSFGGPK